MAAIGVTHPKARCSVLSLEEQAATGCSHRWRVLQTDIAYATATATDDVLTLTLGATPTNWIVDKALCNVTTAVAGTTGTVTLAVGSTSAIAAFVSAQSIKTAGPLEMVSTLPILTSAQGVAAVNLVATLTQGTGGSLSAVTAGQVEIYLNVVNLDKGDKILQAAVNTVQDAGLLIAHRPARADKADFHDAAPFL